MRKGGMGIVFLSLIVGAGPLLLGAVSMVTLEMFWRDLAAASSVIDGRGTDVWRWKRLVGSMVRGNATLEEMEAWTKCVVWRWRRFPWEMPKL